MRLDEYITYDKNKKWMEFSKRKLSRCEFKKHDSTLKFSQQIEEKRGQDRKVRDEMKKKNKVK